MNTVIQVVTQDTPYQLLTHPAHVVRFHVEAADGIRTTFYDTAAAVATQAQPALLLNNLDPAFVGEETTSTDCAGITQTYTHNGVGYAAQTDIEAGTATLPAIAVEYGSCCNKRVDLVLARGLLAVVSGGTNGVSTSTVEVEYYMNISTP